MLVICSLLMLKKVVSKKYVLKFHFTCISICNMCKLKSCILPAFVDLYMHVYVIYQFFLINFSVLICVHWFPFLHVYNLIYQINILFLTTAGVELSFVNNLFSFCLLSAAKPPNSPSYSPPPLQKINIKKLSACLVYGSWRREGGGGL